MSYHSSGPPCRQPFRKYPSQAWKLWEANGANVQAPQHAFYQHMEGSRDQVGNEQRCLFGDWAQLDRAERKLGPFELSIDGLSNGKN